MMIIQIIINPIYMTAAIPPQFQSLPTRGLKSTPSVWLQEKSSRDASLFHYDPLPSNIWHLENKNYDLSSFIHEHPGGSAWLEMTRGQDITQLFFVHHLNQAKARERLAQYQIKSNSSNNQKQSNAIQRFTFDKDGLYMTVKRKVLEKFKIQDLTNENPSKIQGVLIIMAFIILVISASLTNSYLLCIATSFTLIGMFGIGHNFIHHRTSMFRYLFLLCGFTPEEMQIMHCISHHMYPNTQLDYQAASLEPLMYVLRSRPPNAPFTEVIITIALMFVQPLNLLLKLVLPFLKRKKYDVRYATPLIVFLSIFLINHNFVQSLKMYGLIYCVFGLLFSRILVCGHRIQSLWTSGEQIIRDFGEHTILVSNDSDLYLQGIFSYVFGAGFNIHTPHHFFPTADHSILPKILPIIQETCRERGIKMTTHTRWGCLKSFSKGIRERIPWKKYAQ